MAPAVEADDEAFAARQRLLPAAADPVQLVVACEAVDEDDRLAVVGTREDVVQANSIGVEVGHRL